MEKKTCRAELLATTVLVAALGCASIARAEEPANSHAATLSEITVTAQRRSENSQKVPISIQVLSGAVITKLGIQSSTDIAQTMPNVEIGLPNGAGNQPTVTIRGIGLADYDTNNAGPNGVYLDGVYLSSPAAQTFQTFDLARIEVLKGPQGTLYGRNASGGAINFITEQPTDKPSAHLYAAYSSFNSINIEGAVGGPIAPNLSGRLSGVYNYSDGFMYNELTHTHENGTNNFAGRGELKWTPTAKFSALLDVNGGRVNNRPAEYRHVGVFVPGTFDPSTFNFQFCSQSAAIAGGCVDAFGYGTNPKYYNGAWQRRQNLEVEGVNASLQLDYDAGKLKWTTISAYEWSNKFHPEDSDAAPFSLVEVNYGVSNYTFTQEARVAYKGERVNGVLGGYYFHERLDQNQPLAVFLDWDKVFGPGSGDGIASLLGDRAHQTRDSEAIFGQGDYQFTEKLKLTLGGRYTGEQLSFAKSDTVQLQSGGYGHFGPVQPLWSFSGLHQNNGAFNYRAALDYQWTQSALTYASVTSGFKSGDFSGGFLSSDATEAARQLRPVVPETVTAYEVGLKSTWLDRRLRVNLAAFYNEYRNEQVFVILPPIPGGTGLPLPVLDNAPKSHTEGVELEMVGRPTENLTLTVNAATLSTRLDQFTSNRSTTPVDYTGHELPLSPRFTFSTIVSYHHRLGDGDASFDVGANYRSNQHFDLSNQPWTSQPGYWLENARAAYTFAKPNLELAVFVRNLSDEKYLTFANDNTNPFGFIEDVVGTPRTIGVSLDYHY